MVKIQQLPDALNRNYLNWLARLEAKAKNMAYSRNSLDWVPIYNRLVADYARRITLVAPDLADTLCVVNNGIQVVHNGVKVVHTGTTSISTFVLNSGDQVVNNGVKVVNNG